MDILANVHILLSAVESSWILFYWVSVAQIVMDGATRPWTSACIFLEVVLGSVYYLHCPSVQFGVNDRYQQICSCLYFCRQGNHSSILILFFFTLWLTKIIDSYTWNSCFLLPLLRRTEALFWWVPTHLSACSSV